VARWSVNRKYKRRDGDPVRLDALAAATDEVKQKHFSDALDWWSMELLVTDRAFRRRGAATQIVRWGHQSGGQGAVILRGRGQHYGVASVRGEWL
jgi:hypothetical protein